MVHLWVCLIPSFIVIQICFTYPVTCMRNLLSMLWKFQVSEYLKHVSLQQKYLSLRSKACLKTQWSILWNLSKIEYGLILDKIRDISQTNRLEQQMNDGICRSPGEWSQACVCGFLYQTIAIILNRKETNRSWRRGMVVNREKDSYGFLVPENILSIS
jgi:hypothetical protein